MNTESTWRAFTDLLFKEADPYLEVRGDRLHTRTAHRRALDLMKEEGKRSGSSHRRPLEWRKRSWPCDFRS